MSETENMGVHMGYNLVAMQMGIDDELKRKQSEASKKAWATRRKKQAKKRSQASKKAWATRKKNDRAKAKHSRAGQKAWRTIRKNREKQAIRSEASRKAWETRRKNKQKKLDLLPPPTTRVRLMMKKIGKK